MGLKWTSLKTTIVKVYTIFYFYFFVVDDVKLTVFFLSTMKVRLCSDFVFGGFQQYINYILVISYPLYLAVNSQY